MKDELHKIYKGRIVAINLPKSKAFKIVPNKRATADNDKLRKALFGF